TLLDRPTTGQVVVGSKDLTAESDTGLRNARRRIGMVFQHANLLSSRTVADNIGLPLEIVNTKKADRRARAEELIELVGLSGLADTYPAQLSGGQRQRVGIARALAADPDVLLCDEPTSALDPGTTEDILALIRAVADRLGLTVVVITHEMSVVKTLCDSVSLLEAGQNISSGQLVQVGADVNSQLSRSLLPLTIHDSRRSDLLMEVNCSGQLAQVGADVNSQLSRSLLPLPIHDSPQADLVMEVIGHGAAVDTSIAATIAEENQVSVAITAANIETLGDTRFAHYLLAI